MDLITILGLTFPVLVLLAVVVMVVISLRRLRERRRQFQTYAATHGFSFTANERLPAGLRDHAYFRGGIQMNFGRKIKNVLRRHKGGVESLVFDYWYVDSTGVSLHTRRTTRATVICLREGKSGAWRVFHHDGPRYLTFSRLHEFIGEGMKTVRIHEA